MIPESIGFMFPTNGIMLSISGGIVVLVGGVKYLYSDLKKIFKEHKEDLEKKSQEHKKELKEAFDTAMSIIVDTHKASVDSIKEGAQMALGCARESNKSLSSENDQLKAQIQRYDDIQKLTAKSFPGIFQGSQNE